MSGFNIKKLPKKFEIQEDSFNSFLCSEEQSKYIKIPSEKLSDDRVSTLYILPSAFIEVDKHISWKTSTEGNLSEQGGILVGNVYKDKDSQSVCGVVQHIIPSVKSGNATYIQFSHQDWILMYKEFEEKYSSVREDEKQLSVIGWYHTHPNMPVNMSVIDKRTHAGFFPDVWQFSVIFNPQRGIWAVFNGSECHNCNGYIYCPDRLEDKSESNVKFKEHSDIASENGKQTNIYQTTTTKSKESFIIKEFNPQSNRQQGNPARSGNSFDQRKIGSVNTENRVKKKGQFIQHYRGKVLSGINTCYYYPINQQTGSQSYFMDDRLVKRFQSNIDEWGFEGDGSVAFIYNSVKNNRHMIESSATKYYTFHYGEDLPVGIIYHAAPGEFIEYITSDCKGYVSGIVLYTAHRKDYLQLCEMFGSYDYILWLNPCNKGEFDFYVFDENARQRTNFSVKRQNSFGVYQYGQQLPYRDQCEVVVVLVEVLNVMIGQLCYSTEKYLYTKDDQLQISKELVAKCFQYLNRYGRISDEFYLVLSFASADTSGKQRINPWIDEFLQVWVFKQNEGGKMQNICVKASGKRTSERLRSPKFALIISNRDVVIERFKKKLIGHVAAVCLNIETQVHQFCRIF